jgi:site-specific DNA-methyltransferase (adenine-specific)
VTPYYDDGTVTIYHGDCREVDVWLSADVLVTDPPYGRAWRRGETNVARGLKSDKHDGIIGDLDTRTRDAALTMWGSRPAFVFGDLTLAPPVGTKLTLVYDKGDAVGFVGAIAGFRRNAEAVYALGAHSSGLGGRSAIIRTHLGHVGHIARATGHPHTKPLDVLRRLIEAVPAGVVADPFMGSGSTLRAAKDLGRRAIGVEVEERYCEVAARRMCQEVLDLGA